jgi:hypothetical protein
MKTAVEWFIINLIQVCGAPPEGTWKEAENLLQQAKEMEKEQIIDAWNTKSKIDGVLTYTDNRTAEQYYNETFKSE